MTAPPMPADLRVSGRRAVRGTLRVPGDKSVSHRSLLLSALATGTSRISGLSDGADVLHTLEAIRAFGAEVSRGADGRVTVLGGALHEPAIPIDTGNSGTGIRLLAGVAAGLPGLTVLHGDASIARRPMERIAIPLRLMGARVDGRDAGRFPPLAIRGGGLVGVDYRLPVASAQVKSAVLLAALTASGETTACEPVRSRAHTEEMLAARGADIEVDGSTVRLRPSTLAPLDETVPGDPSQAAFWLVGAAALADSSITVEDLYLGPARAGFLDVLRRMGADITVAESGSAHHGGTINVRTSHLVSTDIEPAEIAGLVDEIPALAVAAALADGVTTISGAAELRVKESDRIATTTSMLRAFGVPVEERPDGLVITGGATLHPAAVDSHGDHRIAMAAAIAALAVDGESVISDFDAVATSYPGFLLDLHAAAPDAVVD